MKLPALSFTLMLAASGISSAASIHVAGSTDTNFVDLVGVPAGSSWVAKIGFLAEGTVLPFVPSFATINASWTNAGEIVFAGSEVFGVPGYFSGTVNFTDAAGLAGKDVYVWFTNGSNGNAVMRSLTVDFRDDNDIPSINSLSIEQQTIAQLQFVVGGYSVASGNPGGSIFPAIPEPSSVLLGSFACIGLIARRRR